jgi:hypothetical protein
MAFEPARDRQANVLGAEVRKCERVRMEGVAVRDGSHGMKSRAEEERRMGDGRRGSHETQGRLRAES